MLLFARDGNIILQIKLGGQVLKHCLRKTSELSKVKMDVYYFVTKIMEIKAKILNLEILGFF